MTYENLDIDYAQVAQDILDEKDEEIFASHIYREFSEPIYPQEPSPYEKPVVERQRDETLKTLSLVRDFKNTPYKDKVTRIDELMREAHSSGTHGIPQGIHEELSELWEELATKEKRMDFFAPNKLPLFRSEAFDGSFGSVVGTHYAIAENIEEFALAITLGRAHYLPTETEHVAVLTPELAEDDSIKELMRALRNNARCSYDRRVDGTLSFGERGILVGGQEYVVEDVIPDIVFVSIFCSLWTSFVAESACKSLMLNRSVESQYKIWTTQVPEISWTVLFPDGQEIDAQRFTRRVDYDIRRKAELPSETYDGLSIVAKNLRYEQMPDAYKHLIGRAALFVKLYRHMCEIEFEEHAATVPEYDFMSAWRRFGGRDYLETIASGVPLDDVIA